MSLHARIKELREERKKISDQASVILTTAAKEKRGMTPEEEQSFEKHHKDVDRLAKEIGQFERQYEAEQSLAKPADDKRGAGREDVDDKGQDPKKTAEQRKQVEAEAYRNWICGGPQALTQEQRTYNQRKLADAPAEVRALSAATGSAGAYTIPQDFEYQLDIAMKYYGGMLQVAETLPTNEGATLPYPSFNDTGNVGARVAENTTVASNVDPTYAVVNFAAYMYTSKIILVPVQLLQDSAFDVEGYLNNAIGERIGRILNTETTTGTGSSQPNGIVTAATAGVTAASATAIAYNDILGLKHSVDPAYRVGAKWMFHDNILLAIKKLVDSNSRPLFIAGGTAQGIQEGSPDTINGDPYVINQDMASAITTGQKTMLYGQLKKYKIRRVRGVQLVRFNERYMDSLQVGFMAFQRNDGNLVDAGTHPVKLLTQA